MATPARAAAESAVARVVTLKPLSIVKLADLDFGSIASGTSAGTVVINPNTGARTVTGGTVAMGAASEAAQFYTYANANAVMQVTRGALPVLARAGGGATMNVTALVLNGPTVRVVNPAGLLDLRVGGTLAVAANQADGVYTGTFEITVTYY